MDLRERQKLAIRTALARAADVPDGLLWTEPATLAGPVSLGLTVNK